MTKEQDVRKFYDEFNVKEQSTAINQRHHKILSWLKQFGLATNNNLLEIGCGTGTLTELMAKEIKEGTMIAVDISPKSIEVATKRLEKHKNLTFYVQDIIDFELNTMFDIIVLPDVLEHIPVELHKKLFAKLGRLLKPTGYVLIHIPNPYHLEWELKHTPHLMQIVDQPLYTDKLCEAVYANKFYIHYLNTYSIWVENCDYQVIVLRQVVDKQYNKLTPLLPLHKRIWNKIRRVPLFFKSSNLPQ